MKELYFYILFAAIFAAEAGLILAGGLDPVTIYSARNIVFNAFVVVVVIYMGWNLSDFGIKKVAIKGVIAAFVSVTILTCFTIIGFIIGKPILGVSLPSASYLLVPLLIILILNIILYAVLAVLGSWAAQRFKPSQSKKKIVDSVNK
jgi:hypothetical protein